MTGVQTCALPICPPKGKLDECPRYEPDGFRTERMENVGCEDLAARIKELTPELKVHAFGHIHRAGMVVGDDGVTYVNAATCNEQYKAVHPPQWVDL